MPDNSIVTSQCRGPNPPVLRHNGDTRGARFDSVNTGTSGPHILALPQYSLRLIVDYLPLRSLIFFAASCRTSRRLLADDVAWRREAHILCAAAIQTEHVPASGGYAMVLAALFDRAAKLPDAARSAVGMAVIKALRQPESDEPPFAIDNAAQKSEIALDALLRATHGARATGPMSGEHAPVLHAIADVLMEFDWLRRHRFDDQPKWESICAATERLPVNSRATVLCKLARVSTAYDFSRYDIRRNWELLLAAARPLPPAAQASVLCALVKALGHISWVKSTTSADRIEPDGTTSAPEEEAIAKRCERVLSRVQALPAPHRTGVLDLLCDLLNKGITPNRDWTQFWFWCQVPEFQTTIREIERLRQA